MSDSTSFQRLGPILDEFIERLRNGENPKIDDYVRRHPSLEDDIRNVFSALLVVEPEEGSEPPDSADRPDDNTPKQLGEYSIVREIGRGGMGVVYEAIQGTLGRRVALKVLPQQTFLTGDRLKRFQQEARSAAKLHHSNIVPVFAVGDFEGVHFYAMQYIEGCGLDAVIDELKEIRKHSKTETDPDANRQTPERTHAPLASTVAVSLHSDDAETTSTEVKESESGASVGSASTISSSGGSDFYRRIARIGLQAAEGLDYAHRRGVLHRDIKPANLLLDGQAGVWIADFGLAKVDDHELTQTGEIVGTLQYMAPERLEGVDNELCDVFALGLTLYELVTLQPAYSATDRATIIQKLLNETPTSPRDINPGIPRDLETIILKAIARSPMHRYESASDMADDLQSFIEGRAIRARQTTWLQHLDLWRRRNPIAAALLTMVAVLVVISAVGSTIFAITLARQNRDLTESRHEANKQLLENSIASARLSINAATAGRRINGIANLKRARDLISEFPELEADTEQLRQIAIELVTSLDLENETSISVPYQHGPSTKPTWGFNSDLSWLARSDEGGHIVICDVDSGSILRKFEEDFTSLNFESYAHTMFSPDDRYLAVIGMNSNHQMMVVVYDLETGLKTIESPLPQSGTYRNISFSRDSSRFAYVDSQAQIVISDPDGEGTYWTSDPYDAVPTWLALGPAGRQLLIDDYQSAKVINTDTETVFEIPGTIGNIQCGTWSPLNRYIALGGHDGDVYLWDTQNTSQPKFVLRGHADIVTRIQFHPDGHLLMTGSLDGTTRLWNVHNGQQVLQADFGGSQFSSDGLAIGFEIAGASYGRHRLHGDEFTQATFGHNRAGQITDLDFTSDSAYMVWAAQNHGVSTWDMKNRQSDRLYDGYYRTLSLDIYPHDNAIFVSGSAAIEMLTITNEMRGGFFTSEYHSQTQLFGDEDMTFMFEVSRDEIIAIADRQNKLWFVQDPDSHDEMDLPIAASSLVVSPNGKWIAIASRQQPLVIIVDRDQREVIAHIEMPESDGYHFGFSPDSSWLMITYEGHIASVETTDWKIVSTAELTTRTVGKVAFANDGQTLAAANFDKLSLFKFDGSNGQLVLIGNLHAFTRSQIGNATSNEACGIIYSSNDQWLAAGTRDNYVQIWDIKRIRDQLKDLGLDW